MVTFTGYARLHREAHRMLDPFEGIAISHAANYLHSALETGNVTHAYLIAGPRGCGHDQLALRFAAALVAQEDERQFDIALRGSHPDIHQLRPNSSAGYLVEQIREIVHDTTLAPVRAARKVYILHHADLMGAAPANAFLKTLEEPPASVHIILLAATEDAVLQTLRSRCQVLAVATNAVEKDQRVLDCESQMGDIFFRIARGAGNRAVLSMAKSLVEVATAETAGLKEAYEAEEKAAEDYLSSGARRNLADSHKRAVTMEQRAGYNALLDAALSWLRDCLMVSQGMSQLQSVESEAEQGAFGLGMGTGAAFVDQSKLDVACNAGTAGIISAIECVNTSRQRIAGNVTPQLALEAMLLEIREALCPR